MEDKMASAHAETVTPTTVHDRVVDAVGRAAHMAHEARLLKTLVSDAVEDGVHAATRAVTRGAREVEDLRDEVAYRVKKAPLASLAVAAGAGLILGVLFAGCRRAMARRREWNRPATPDKAGV
jgi:ElaB/YqjD/DUF883 family membrane-anchored ribosome-binding protein